MRVRVVAEREPGRRFGGAGGRDLQVEALHAAVRGARGDLEAVAPTFAGAGREQPVAAATDVQQRGASLLLPKELVPGANSAPVTQAPSVLLARLIR